MNLVTGLKICNELHNRVQNLPRYRFGEEADNPPLNGVYFVFERGQNAHDGARIVMIGSHTGDGNLSIRIREHATQNKDRSIFRKQIGRALLLRSRDPFLEDWNIDLTTRKNRDMHASRISKTKLATIEEGVSKFIRENLSFTVAGCASPEAALRLKALCIGTVSKCSDCAPTSNWLGHSSPKAQISQSGLWQIIGLYKSGLQQTDLEALFK